MKCNKSVCIVSLMLIILAGVLIFVQNTKLNQCKNRPAKVVVKTKTKTKVVYKEPKGVIVSINKQVLLNDLKANSKHLSKRNRELIVNTIEKASKRYGVNELVLYGLIYTESSFRYWITHRQVVIKGKKDNAIGLAAIVYLWWGEKLKKAGLIETRSDLYNIENNIMSCAFILNELEKMSLVKGTTTKTESALRRYFGGNYKWYSQRIENKIGSLVFSKIYH